MPANWPTNRPRTSAQACHFDRLTREPERGEGVRIVYVSPLKALSYDIERNLRAPLRGIGGPAADISVGLRTGDTSQADRRSMRRDPPDILITTPESLYLMLSSGAREILASAEAVIVDEIHAMAQSKRGSHLALTLERLEWLAQKARREGEEEVPEALQRIGLSATQRPLERIASFLVGPGRECRIVDAGRTKQLDLEIVVPVEDMSDPGSSGSPDVPGRPADGMPSQHTSPERVDPNFDGASNPRSIWPAIYPELLRLVREHTSTIIFVNNRRGAERLAKRLNELNLELLEQEGAQDRERPLQRVASNGTDHQSAMSRRMVGPIRRQDPLARPNPRSPAPTTGRSPTRSGSMSRSC